MFRLLVDSVQAALAGAIASRLAGLGVPSGIGYPVGGPKEEHVWVAADFDVALPRRTSGGFSRDEDGTVKVRILVTKTTDDPLDPLARALVLEAAVEDAVGADPTLEGLMLEAKVASVQGEEAIAEDRRRQYGITVTVAYAAAVAA
jgi:hypothetical protein